jgi:glucose-1-phosphate cytidylyltransferase
MGGEMNVVILCGGQGTRAYPTTRRIPKALMEVAGLPIVEHVMRIYAAFGHREFILATGYLRDEIAAYFASGRCPADWRVLCVDTGDTADTGERLLKCRDYLTPTFHATYCDGLGNVDLDALVAHHDRHDGVATMTAVPLRSQYGIVHSDDDGRVRHFEEKPVIPDRWINAGFFVFDREAFDDWHGRNLEREVLPDLASKGRLFTYRHGGFWRSMDTYKDQQELNGLWAPYAEQLAMVAA